MSAPGGSRPGLLVMMPLPPPYSGQERVTAALLGCGLGDEYELLHCDVSHKRSNAERGKLNLQNLRAGLRILLCVLWVILRRRPRLAHVALARNGWGFLKKGALVLLSRALGLRVVARLGGDHFDVFYRAQGWPYRAFVRLVLGQLDALIVEAERLRAQFRGLVPEERLHAIYAPYDPSDMADVRRNRPRDSATGPVRVLSVGHVSVAKGALDVVRAVPAIRTALGEVTVTLCGDQILTERNIVHVDHAERSADVVLEAIGEFTRPGEVRLAGLLTGQAYRDAFRAADVFVFPSYSEGMPYAVLDAVAAGVPVVATRVGALPEVFSNDEIAFVEFGAPAQVARAVIRLVRHPDEASRAAQAAYAKLTRVSDPDGFRRRMSGILADLRGLGRHLHSGSAGRPVRGSGHASQGSGEGRDPRERRGEHGLAL